MVTTLIIPAGERTQGRISHYLSPDLGPGARVGPLQAKTRSVAEDFHCDGVIIISVIDRSAPVSTRNISHKQITYRGTQSNNTKSDLIPSSPLLLCKYPSTKFWYFPLRSADRGQLSNTSHHTQSRGNRC